MIQVGKPVKGREFIGREKEIKEIMAYLEMGQSVVLIAPRRFGKTSLVLEIMRRLKKKKHFTGMVDIFSYATLSSLTHAVVEEVLDNSGFKKTYQSVKGSITSILKNVSLKATVEDFDFILKLEDQQIDDWTKFSESIDFIDDFGGKAQKKIIFAFDEFGDLLKFDQSHEIIKMLRAKIQNQQAATYIFSGSYESIMDKLFVDSKSPFYRLARIVHIGYLEFNVLKKQMIRKLTAQDITPDVSLIEDTLDFLKCHPYYSQLALQQMYIHHLKTGDSPSLDQLIDAIISIDRAYLEKLWEDIAKRRENMLVLKYLSSGQDGLYTMARDKKINASRAVNYLEGIGIIYKSQNGFEFYDPIFQFWIQENIT